MAKSRKELRRLRRRAARSEKRGDAPAGAAPSAVMPRADADAGDAGEAARARRWRLSREETRVVAFAVAVKVTLGLAMLLFSWNYTALAEVFNLNAYFPAAHNAKELHASLLWYTKDQSAWYLPLAYWDGQHYLLLSEYGYNHGYDRTSGQQFYPLYPLLIRAVSVVLPTPAAALLLNYFFTAGLALFLFRMALQYGGGRPWVAVLVALAFPTAFYATTVHTEPLFIFLLAGFLWHFCHTGRRVYLLYFGLLPLARGSAAFVLPGLILCALLMQARLRGMRFAASAAPPAAGADWRPYAHCLAAFAAGVAVYLTFFYFVTGSPVSGITAQERYGTPHRISNLFNFPHVWKLLSGAYIAELWSKVSYFTKFSQLSIWLMLAAAVLLMRTRQWALLCFYVPLYYGHAFSGLFISFIRFALILSPFLALAAVKLVRTRRHAAVLYALCAISFAVQLYLAASYSLYIWVDG